MNLNFKLKSLEFEQNFGIFKHTKDYLNHVFFGFNIFKNSRFFIIKYSIYLQNIRKILESNISMYFLQTYIVRFYLKGIGYKFLRPKKFKNFLKIELGHSVSTYIKIPAFIKIFNKRDKIILIGTIRSNLINFSHYIFSLRPADVYKGKGVRLSTLPYTTFKAGKQR